jgi:hypothetical protein
VKGTRLHVYEPGEWFMPCKVFDKDCHQRIDEEAALGKLPAEVVGHHQYTASWW